MPIKVHVQVILCGPMQSNKHGVPKYMPCWKPLGRWLTLSSLEAISTLPVLFPRTTLTLPLSLFPLRLWAYLNYLRFGEEVIPSNLVKSHFP